MHETLEGSAGKLPKFLLRLTAKCAQDGAVQVENLSVVIPVYEKAAGHLIGKTLDLPGGQAFPVPKIPAAGQ